MVNKKTLAVIVSVSALVSACIGLTLIGGDDPAVSVSGWQLVSMPFTTHKSDVVVYHNDFFFNWSDAVDQSLVLDFVYGWNRTNHIYELSNIFQENHGYWVYLYEDNTTLLSNSSVVFCGSLVVSSDYNNTFYCKEIVVVG